MIATLPPPLRRAVSSYTGIVRSVEECLVSPSEPAYFQASCEVAHGGRLTGGELAHVAGVGGIGRSRSEAAAAAVGEALERYSASYVPRGRLVVASAAELGDAAVAPARFALFSERQLAAPGFRYRRFDDTTRVAWVEGWSLPGRSPAYLPAELVFLGDAAVAGARIAYSTSSGLACADSLDTAVFRGLCEVLERDAFMLVWANRLSLPLLDLSGSAAPDELAAFSRPGLPHAAVDLSTFHRFPIVLAVVRGPAGRPGALGVGAAAATTVEAAWWKALTEAFATRTAGVKLRILDPRRDFGPHGADVRSFDDHIVFYADPRNAGATAFLDAGPECMPGASVAPLEGATEADRIEALCRRVAAAGSTAYAVDVTSPDVAELGLTVARVLAPELCPLDVSHAARFLGGRRLTTAAADLGLREGVLDEADLNPDPHPFP